MTILYFHLPYFVSQIVLCFSLSILVFYFYIYEALTLSITCVLVPV